MSIMGSHNREYLVKTRVLICFHKDQNYVHHMKTLKGGWRSKLKIYMLESHRSRSEFTNSELSQV